MPNISVEGRFFRKYPVVSPLGYTTKPLQLSTADTAFVLVDVYGPVLDVHPDAAEAEQAEENRRVPISVTQKSEIVRQRIRPALDAARKLGLPIVYVANSAPRIALNRSTYWEHKWDTLNVDKDVYFAETSVDPREYHHGGTGVLDYSDVIAPRSDDYFIRKYVHSGFYDTRLDSLLRNLAIKNLVFVGFALDVCLGTTMIDALWRNYRVIMLRDCVHASEIPTVDAPGEWTKRWVLYVECAIGYTTTSDAWVQACASADASL